MTKNSIIPEKFTLFSVTFNILYKIKLNKKKNLNKLLKAKTIYSWNNQRQDLQQSIWQVLHGYY